MIAGFQTPTGGDILIAGEPVRAVPPWRRSIGMVFQRLALVPHLTAAANVAFPLRMRRFDARTINERVERYLELVRLGGLGGRRINQLSGGQQQRVAIARALVFEPDLLLLDEPLASLDRKLREEMQLEFRRIQRELGVTTINVTHDQREALIMSDEIIVMDKGRVQQMGRPAVTYRAPANPFVAGFIGVTNFLSGTRARLGRRRGDARASATRSWPAGPAPAGRRRRSRASAALRAEQIRIAVERRGAGRARHGARGRRRRRDLRGRARRLRGRRSPPLGGVTLRVFDHDPQEHAGFAASARVFLGWNPRDLLVLPVDPAVRAGISGGRTYEHHKDPSGSRSRAEVSWAGRPGSAPLPDCRASGSAGRSPPEPAKPAEIIVRAWGGVWVDSAEGRRLRSRSPRRPALPSADLTEDNEIQPKVWAAVEQGRVPPININWDTTINATKSALRGVTEDLSDLPNLAGAARPRQARGPRPACRSSTPTRYVYVLAYRERGLPGAVRRQSWNGPARSEVQGPGGLLQ